MRKMRNFDQISLLLVLAKHKWLFLASFALCLTLGTLFIFSLKKQTYTPPKQEAPIQQAIFLKVAQYKQIAIPEALIKDILNSFNITNLLMTSASTPIKMPTKMIILHSVYMQYFMKSLKMIL